MTLQSTLSIVDISKTYTSNGTMTPVLTGITATFTEGTSYAITGASGSGKSTLLHLIGGIDEPTSGALLYNGRDLAHFSAKEREAFRRGAVGFMFQNHYLINELSVQDNVALGGRIAGRPTPAAIAAARELLDQVGLVGKENRLPHELSGGEQQRAALARALVNHPKFLLADEPTGNLDADTATRITDLIVHAQKSWNLGIIVCTHDLRIATRLDTTLHLERGTLTAVQSSPQP